MIKSETKIVLFSVIAILLFWAIAAVVDTLLHYDEPFLHVLIFSLFFMIYGLFMAKVFGRQKQAEDLLKHEISLRKLAEESLRDAVKRAEDEKAKSEAILAAIGDGLSIQDTNFRVLYQNQIHKDIVGGDKAGEYCYAAYQRRDEVCDGCHVAESFQDGKIHKKDQVRTTDKGKRYYEIVSSPLRDSTGKIIAGIELVRDISERAWTEEALAESEKRYRLLFESAPDAIFILEAEGEDAGRIVTANRTAAAMHDYALDELYSMKITDLDAPGSAQEAHAMMRRILAGEWVKAEISHRKKDGTVFPVEVSAGPLELGGHSYVLAFDRDITVRRTAEEAREKLIRDLRDALDKIKTLRGLLPICASCKKIRDDKGYWNQIETYIQSHTEADFSHGICPECAERLYPEFSNKEKT